MNCSNLRVFLFSILLAALLSGTTLRSLISAEHPGITHTLLFKGQVSGTDEQVIVWDTRYAPGAVNTRHLHPAAVTFRVISGTGNWQEEGKPPVTLHAGETLLASAGTVHTHWNPSTTEPLRFIELIVAEDGQNRSVPRP
jgi:quercetin dioxygenase-like cupin family protein